MKDLKKISSPVLNAKITSNYGYRVLNYKLNFHNGIDIVSTTYVTDVFSILDGEVVFDFDLYKHELRFKDTKHSGGNYVIIKSIIDNEIYFLKYLHLLKNFVSLAEKVKSGQKIGIYGDVGYSFGSHLHISVYNHRWDIINPNIVFKKIGLRI